MDYYNNILPPYNYLFMTSENMKLVVVVKDGLENGKAMNALAHSMLGFGVGTVSKEEVRLNRYIGCLTRP